MTRYILSVNRTSGGPWQSHPELLGPTQLLPSFLLLSPVFLLLSFFFKLEGGDQEGAGSTVGGGGSQRLRRLSKTLNEIRYFGAFGVGSPAGLGGPVVRSRIASLGGGGPRPALDEPGARVAGLPCAAGHR